MITLWLFILIGAIIAFFWFGRQIAEAAQQHAIGQAEKLNVQLLSVACVKRRLAVLSNGKLGIKSQFAFEFSSDQQSAYTGTMYLENLRLKKMDIPPHRMM
ncbi:DUF3301 domain-containing protein [Pseudoalteromonas rubra]|uniref:DUF3301 domain-containing protein n=1 Tax=Pseudoalteromonas rubra TaxID=43658 RepID=A0A5S3WFJ9_9GAMM|nr:MULTISPECIES: DUF3301 domain-containing protein [Pseudoalteromonas]AZZ99158.1 DUF3301 domain-containing protein [Pseudoalteromonas sp. R3]MCO7189659.1 DUF3301 domain-containing protein [Pseudoalteromonas sp. XMcav2-N]TMP23987.1 DUF3301 domain-containing protein [Pseudoalteromonas rubra]TMP27555.1 DUF3301 domain-containing protein [Pseudoalteromonas rubra]TMP33344.1 DUF3301 domain-containing protein [Pseudoalteromonas rubra]